MRLRCVHITSRKKYSNAHCSDLHVCLRMLHQIQCRSTQTEPFRSLMGGIYCASLPSLSGPVADHPVRLSSKVSSEDQPSADTSFRSSQNLKILFPALRQTSNQGHPICIWYQRMKNLKMLYSKRQAALAAGPYYVSTFRISVVAFHDVSNSQCPEEPLRHGFVCSTPHTRLESIIVSQTLRSRSDVFSCSHRSQMRRRSHAAKHSSSWLAYHHHSTLDLGA